MLHGAGGGSTSKGMLSNRGPKICQMESTKVGAVWKQTTSLAVNGYARCIHPQRFRIPVGPRALSTLPPLHRLANAALQDVTC